MQWIWILLSLLIVPSMSSYFCNHIQEKTKLQRNDLKPENTQKNKSTPKWNVGTRICWNGISLQVTFKSCPHHSFQNFQFTDLNTVVKMMLSVSRQQEHFLLHPPWQASTVPASHWLEWGGRTYWLLEPHALIIFSLLAELLTVLAQLPF